MRPINAPTVPIRTGRAATPGQTRTYSSDTTSGINPSATILNSTRYSRRKLTMRVIDAQLRDFPNYFN
jgi:hypothetical protein